MSLTVKQYLESRIATSREIQAATNLNQSAVSRQLRKLKDEVIKIPNGRSPKYALTKTAFGADDCLPLYMVDQFGNRAVKAFLRPLVTGGFFLEPRLGMPKVLLGVNKDGLYDDIPYFLDDLRPQGFIGKQIANEMAKLSDDFPPDPDRWTASHIGRYLISNGEDAPGNFIFGNQAGLRLSNRSYPGVTERDYPDLADKAMRGIVPNSSAGGEQPKFTAYLKDRSIHVIVKFSPRDKNPVAQRWRDVLITEFHASQIINKVAYPAATSRLIEKDNRLFLETERFDRKGEHGRMPMISLLSVDAEFTGELHSNWLTVISALHNKELISQQDLTNAFVFWGFGRVINNTDMHLGNLSLAIEGNLFRLLPIYDMCSMGFAPKRGGDLLPFQFTIPTLEYVFEKPENIFGKLPSTVKEEIINLIKDMALLFWDNLEKDERISEEFKSYLSNNTVADTV